MCHAIFILPKFVRRSSNPMFHMKDRGGGEKILKLKKLKELLVIRPNGECAGWFDSSVSLKASF